MIVKMLAVVALLAVAQIFPSCGGQGTGDSPGVGTQAQVIGWIEEKRTRVWETVPYIIVINRIEYGVSYEFWTSVDVGDLVKNEGGKWTIVRKARR